MSLVPVYFGTRRAAIREFHRRDAPELPPPLPAMELPEASTLADGPTHGDGLDITDLPDDSEPHGSILDGSLRVPPTMNAAQRRPTACCGSGILFAGPEVIKQHVDLLPILGLQRNHLARETATLRFDGFVR